MGCAPEQVTAVGGRGSVPRGTSGRQQSARAQACPAPRTGSSGLMHQLPPAIGRERHRLSDASSLPRGRGAGSGRARAGVPAPGNGAGPGVSVGPRRHRPQGLQSRTYPHGSRELRVVIETHSNEISKTFSCSLTLATFRVLHRHMGVTVVSSTGPDTSHHDRKVNCAEGFETTEYPTQSSWSSRRNPLAAEERQPVGVEDRGWEPREEAGDKCPSWRRWRLRPVQ